ncbi:MAG TPA: YidC/Oxa1 family insertase periplasmic-domain containing protein [Pirellulales bacterium]|nr:YidC/Oxa1 family insertase periplasmic-domain containing protein [Pirellulales bacterium]
MDRRFSTFIALSALVLLVNILVMKWLAPPPGQQPVAQNQDAEKDRAEDERPRKPKKPKQGAAAGNAEEDQADVGAADKARPDKAQVKAPAKEVPEQWISLGSADASSPYRMMPLITNRGAAVERIELNSPRFHDLEDRTGYLGRLNPIDVANGRGCQVRVVGAGTPAARAGLKPDDVIAELNGAKVGGAKEFDGLLEQTEPGQTVELKIERAGKPLKLTATLARRPLEIIRPEATDTREKSEGEPLAAQPGMTKAKDIHPLSFLLTLESIDGDAIAEDDAELLGLHLRDANWTVLPRDPKKPDEVSLEMPLPDYGLRVEKTYSVAKVGKDEQDDIDAPAYHLTLEVRIENLGDEEREVAYRLDGPTGLPTEGWWYAYSAKIGREWSSPGVRDPAAGYLVGGAFQHSLVNAQRIAEDQLPPQWTNPLVYLGVDAQYFATMLIPQQRNDKGEWTASALNIDKAFPIRVGPVPADKNKKKLVDTSCRLISAKATLAANGGAKIDHFKIFAGPKRPDLLAKYAAPHGLGELVYYGWFGWVSRPMLGILHFFYDVVRNYGIAIIMLTVLVRSCMFPLSRKQALNAQKMQELQPEIKRLAEKYKGNVEQKTKAQQELFRKHNYNPLSGCLPALVQLPIFLGLYRSLAVDIELRQAPLLGEAVRWCSNLAAPDMLWYWELLLPAFIAGKTGWLGPYLNVLPLITIGLFIWQQKMFLPPPADEQAALQQKMMQYMMIFMGVMFFKVPSGLCLYFIASSLWGIAERKLLPKAKPPAMGVAAGKPLPAPTSNGNGADSRRKNKERGRK